MKIAIHNRAGSFSERWIEYCEENNIDYKIINLLENGSVEELKDCDAVMWHHHHNNYKDVISAKKILFALEHAGTKVFPNFYTGWHFDDKIAQKYLLEAINAPVVPSYVFYDKNQAIEWALKTKYPKVFKLKGGAGAANVFLVRSAKEAVTKINKSFGKGYEQFNSLNNLNERIRRFKNKKGSFTDVIKGIGRIYIEPQYSKILPNEKGYAYFQDFVPHNDSDTRIIVIRDKAFAIKRMTRQNDFRASGSGKFIYDKSQIDINAIKTAFDVNSKLKSQCIAFDFIFDETNKPLIVEISYGFTVQAYEKCPGYWDQDLEWHEGPFNPQSWMISNLISDIK